MFGFLGLVSVAGLFMVSAVARKHLFMVSVVGLFMVSDVAGNVFKKKTVPVVGFVMVSGRYRTAPVLSDGNHNKQKQGVSKTN